MTSLVKKKKIKVIRKYKDTITWTCPVRGEVSEEVEIPVYSSGIDFLDEIETISLDSITAS